MTLVSLNENSETKDKHYLLKHLNENIYNKIEHTTELKKYNSFQTNVPIKIRGQCYII